MSDRIERALVLDYLEDLRQKNQRCKEAAIPIRADMAVKFDYVIAARQDIREFVASIGRGRG